MINMKFEILAPAGSMESLIAGVRSGANAVYLGGKLFNARRNAGNFYDEELKQAVEYCHQRCVKVYLTLNILVKDEEFHQLYEAVKSALEAGVDAFIVQDVGVAKFIKAHFPDARLHGSTQMSIMSPKGAEFAKELGFKRIVLPREMSKSEIEEVAKSTDLELEMFVHGALCMCVSGQCYLSSVLGSRSGNRGLCAQPCRLPFTARDEKEGKGDCVLSLKDLSLVSYLNEIDGVMSLKIEGRMKRPEYVAAAVSAVKKAINGTIEPKDEYALKSVFSRSGFTDGYFTGKLGRDMFGTRQKEDVLSAKEVLKEIEQTYKNENPLLPMDINFVCRENQPCTLTATAMDKTVTVTGDIPEKAINKPMTEESVIQRLSKLGGTQFYPQKVTASIDDGLILPVSKLNELRRKAVEEITKLPEITVNVKPFTPTEKQYEKDGVKYLTASFKNADQIPDRHPFKHVFIPLDSSLDDFVDNRAGVVLPRGIFGIENEIKDRLIKLKKAGVTKALCGNAGTYKLAKETGFEVFGDFGLNVFNSLSAQEFENCILSFELTTQQANTVQGENTGTIVYGHLPLMLTRNCPIKSSVGCYNCQGRITDRMGYNFPVICSKYPCTEILNSVPVYMLDRMNEIKTDFAHFYFSTETKEQVENIISLYEQNKIKKTKPDFKYTRGLYQRGAI